MVYNLEGQGRALNLLLVCLILVLVFGLFVYSSFGSMEIIGASGVGISGSGKLLDLGLKTDRQGYRYGDVILADVNLVDTRGDGRIDVHLDLQLINPETGETVNRNEETVAVDTSLDKIVEMPVYYGLPNGRYMLKAVAYSNPHVNSTAIVYVWVEQPFLKRDLFGIPLWIYVVVIVVVIVLIVLVKIIMHKHMRHFHRKRSKRKKRR